MENTDISIDQSQIVNSLFSIQLLNEICRTQNSQTPEHIQLPTLQQIDTNYQQNLNVLKSLEFFQEKQLSSPSSPKYKIQNSEIEDHILSEQMQVKRIEEIEQDDKQLEIKEQKKEQMLFMTEQKIEESRHTEQNHEIKNLNLKLKRSFENLVEKVSGIVEDLESDQKYCHTERNSRSSSRKNYMSIKKAYNVNILNLQTVQTQPNIRSKEGTPKMKAQAYKSNLKNEISSLSSQNSVIKMKSINLLKASTNPLSFSNSRDKSLNRSKSKGLSLISPRSKPKKFENTTNPSKIFLTHVHQEKKGKKENICKNINKKMTHNKKGSSVNPNSFFNNRRIKAINKLI